MRTYTNSAMRLMQQRSDRLLRQSVRVVRRTFRRVAAPTGAHE